MTNVVSGFAAQCCGPAFFVYGEAAESDVGGGRWTGRGGQRGCGARGRRSTGGATCEKRARGLSLGKTKRCFLGGSGKGAAGCGCRRENSACDWVGTQLVEGGGLWPQFQLIQLIYLRYLCGDTERREWRCPCFPSLCIYSIS